MLACLLGFVNVLDMPTRQAFVIELVGKDDLMNAIAMNSMAFNVARVIGPSIAGLIMGYFSVLVPVYAKEALHQGEKTFGLLMSCMGMGSFFGAMFVATLSKSGPNQRVVKIFPWVASGLMAGIGLMNHFATAGLLLALTGFVFVAFASSANSTMQLNASDEFRGRVMSVYTLVFAGSTPFGSMFAGGVTELFGPKGGFIACGLSAILLLAIAMFLTRKSHGAS